MLKKIMLAVVAVGFAGTAYAGAYHTGVDLKCWQCHTMHNSTAQITSTKGNPTRTAGFADDGIAYDNLLTLGSTTETCLNCHGHVDSRYNVNAAVRTPGSTQYVPRSAGFLENGVADTFRGHTLDPVAKIEPPGFDGVATVWTDAAAGGFNCGDCHEVHGNAAYRNLGPGKTGDYTTARNVTFGDSSRPTYVASADPSADYSVDVRINQTNASYNSQNLLTPLATNARVYNAWRVSYANGGGANRMDAFCAKCHGDFHGATNTQGSTGNFKRHPTAGVVFSDGDGGFQATASTILAARNVRQVRNSATTNAAGCLTCHKAHGSTNMFGLYWPATTEVEHSLVSESGSGGASYGPQNLCTSCHNQNL